MPAGTAVSGRGIGRRRLGLAASAPLLASALALGTLATPTSARLNGAPGGVAPPPVLQLSSPPLGADVSYPECGGSLPVGQAFMVVGVNGGLASVENPCLAFELGWAVYRTVGRGGLPPASLYLNTGDPGNSYDGQPVTDWPESGDSPLGSCLPTVAGPHLRGPGQNSAACSWEYGYLKVEQDLIWLRAAASRDGVPGEAAAYPVWLDVETSNTWQAGTSLNVADLDGMVAALHQAGVHQVGVYAAPSGWREITGAGTNPASAALYPLPDWVLGVGSLRDAKRNCQDTPITGGPVLLAQFLPGGVDADYAC
ncbi:MAG: hypothetical protein ACRENY_03020 [Candidatus Dormibacteria bacterium]